MRGATPAQLSRVLDREEINKGVLYAPFLERDPGQLEPRQRSMPTMVEMKAMTDVELSQVLGQFGITEPWAQMRSANVGYLMRMTQIPPGSQQFKAALDRLLNQGTRDGLIRASRRAYQEYMIIQTDTSGELLRIAENDENTCEVCNALAGEVGTIEYHRSIGLPGAASCDGGDRCRCNLVPA
jgi:hypothetical protein